MIEGAYVQYQSAKAAEDMFCEMRLLINDIMMNHIHFISDETAATVLDLAIRIGEAEGGERGRQIPNVRVRMF